VVALEEFLGKGLRSLELRGGGSGAEAGNAGGMKAIDDAGHQRCLWANDGQRNALVLRQLQQPLDVVGIDHHIAHAALERGTGIARCHQHFGDAAGHRAFPREGMFTSAIANHQDFHVRAPDLMPEMPHAGVDHRHAVFVCRGDHFLVAH
jgi:hypothetical protein